MSAITLKKVSETALTIALVGFVCSTLTPPDKVPVQFAIAVLWFLGGFLVRDIWSKP